MRYRTMAYVVVFNRGTPNEGVYTLETQVGGLKGQLLSFENSIDARRFAQMLRREDFKVVGGESSVSLEAQPFMWDTRRIEQFCQGGDFEVALVPSGGTVTPPEKNLYDPARFGERLPSPEEKFERRTTMRGSMWDNAPRGYNQRQHAQNILRKTNKSNQRRGQEVWAAAMRNAQNDENNSQANFGAEMCGFEECGLDKYLFERDLFESLYGSGPWGQGPPGPGPWGRGPGPYGHGPYGHGPYGSGPYRPELGPNGSGPWGA